MNENLKSTLRQENSKIDNKGDWLTESQKWRETQIALLRNVEKHRQLSSLSIDQTDTGEAENGRLVVDTNRVEQSGSVSPAKNNEEYQRRSITRWQRRK